MYASIKRNLQHNKDRRSCRITDSILANNEPLDTRCAYHTPMYFPGTPRSSACPPRRFKMPKSSEKMIFLCASSTRVLSSQPLIADTILANNEPLDTLCACYTPMQSPGTPRSSARPPRRFKMPESREKIIFVCASSTGKRHEDGDPNPIGPLNFKAGEGKTPRDKKCLASLARAAWRLFAIFSVSQVGVAYALHRPTYL
jgi:hypothetical protein